jgi:YVTN family beta-propeller protein
VNRGLEYHPDTHIAASRVWTIDLSTGEKVGDVSVRGKNPGWLVLHPDGRTAYVVVSVKQGKESIPQGQEGILQGVVGIDLISGQITSRFPLRGYPVGLCTTSDRSRLFVTNVGIIEGPRLTGAPLSLIDTGTGNTAEVELKDSSYGICLSPDDRTAYVSKPYQGLVQVIDVINGTLIANIRVTGSSQWITRSPDGKRLYVVVKKRYKTAEEPNSLVAIDTATNSITHIVEVGPGPEGVALTPEGRFIYVTNRNYIHGSVTQGSVTVIDAVDNSVITTIPAGEEPIAVCTITD